MKIKPLFDRIVVVAENEDNTQNGIFLGSVNQDKPIIGKVLYVGAGNENEDGKKLNMYVNEGDKILFSKFSAVEANIDAQQVYILRQTDILAVIE